MNSPSNLDRLTAREKDCLRLWLDHKTAKEIALDLGISHHAVEKRLKMARTKLDVGSTIEAARMLADSEGYQRTVTGSPDLQDNVTPSQARRHQSMIIGGLAMSLAAVVALVLVSTSASPGSGEIEVDGNLEKVFDHLDKDANGYLESPESPFVVIAFRDGDGAETMEGEAVIGDSRDADQIAEFYADADTDADGRVSFREYYSWSEARWGEMGIEIKKIVKVMPEPGS